MMSGIDVEQQLVNAIASFAHDPLGFVRFAFPWGEDRDRAGLGYRAAGLASRAARRSRTAAAREPRTDPHCQGERSRGRQIDRSRRGLTIWALSTMPDARVVVTANTETQLRTKTWPEVIKWLRLAIHRHWFRSTATAVYSADPLHERLWRADAIPWSEENTEAFAGLHNQGRRVRADLR